MEMTIEESKKRLAIEKELAIKTGLNHDANGTLADAIDVAIETMRKYQKIEQIIEGYFVPFSQDIASQCMSEIKEVIEDESESYD